MAAPLKVLFVDDDPTLLGIYPRIFANTEVSVLTAARPSEALPLADHVDAVVTDLHMPDGGGLALMRQLRALDADLPVLLLTGHPDLESAEEAIELGATRYLRKPIDPTALRRAVHTAGQAFRAVRAEREGAVRSGLSVLLRGRDSLEQAFERALSQIYLVFQPVLSAKLGSLVALEALLRGREPSFTSPATLLGTAERLDRVQELGQRVRALAAEAMDQVPAGVDLYVNLHARELLDPDLYDPAAPLSRRARRVVLEITERTAIDEVNDLRLRLAELRSLGYRIAVDDLGAGYAALASLAELEPEVVKLDMSLVRGIAADHSRSQIVAAVTGLCARLGAMVVAEGVETDEEHRVVTGLGCHLVQGFLFGRPGPLRPRD